MNHSSQCPAFVLVLGGGGVRGLAHVGVLKALEHRGLVPSMIVGTSMGAVVGGMYAQLLSADEVEKRIMDFLQSDDFKKIGLEQFSDSETNEHYSVLEQFASHLRQRYFISKSALGTGDFAQATLIQSLHKLLIDGMIEETRIPFAAVATDLVAGKEIIQQSGSIIFAVAASSAVPGVIAPLEHDGQLLIDGTVTSTIPVQAARTISQDPLIAIDVRRSLGSYENHHRGIEILMRSGTITNYTLNQVYLQNADVVLHPDVSAYDWNEFRRGEKCIRAGLEAVNDSVDRISNLLTTPR
ncbi:MAG: patatin-like phospholipase family protein [Bacteroidota bacterium]|nr:patatin-like phospholipase family protein [Bacteroidota bacterium]